MKQNDWKILTLCLVFFGLFILAGKGSLDVKSADAVVYEDNDGWQYTITNGTAVVTDYTGSETEVTVPERMTYDGQSYRIQTVGDYCFQNCYRLQSVTIPEQITSLGKGAFKNCTSLSEVTILGDLADCSNRSVSTVGSPAESTQSVGYSVFYNAGHNAESLTITFGDNVTYIPAYLFATGYDKSNNTYCYVTDIKISDSVEEIGEYAFYNCFALQSVTFGNGVKIIDEYSFANCTALQAAVMGTRVNEIGEDAFLGCSKLKILSLNNSLATISSYAFQDCTSLEEVVLPSSLKMLEKGAFKNCTFLNDITIQSNLADCSERSISTIGSPADKTQSIGLSVFYNAGTNADVFTVTFTNGVTKVPAYLFATGYDKGQNVYCHITDVKIPDSVTEIGNGAFYNCYDLKTLRIGSGIKTIGEKMFTSSPDLTIYGYTNSVAETCASEYGIPFVSVGAVQPTASGSSTGSGSSGSNNTSTTSGSGTSASNNKNFSTSSKSSSTSSASLSRPFISKVKNKKKRKLVVKWSKNKSASGYQIQYSKKSSFKNKKTKTVKSSSKGKITLKKLKKGKIYYIRVRSYKTVAGKKTYSSWSYVRSVRIVK